MIAVRFVFLLYLDVTSRFILFLGGEFMEYTVKQLGDLAGVSGRNLRYYDQIDLLKPAWVSEAGYRMYGPAEVKRLQQILFYRELGVDLQTIKALMDAPHFDEKEALRQHRERLLEKRRQLDLLLQNVDQTLAALEGGTPMEDKDRFRGFKEKLIRENEEKYGKEARERWGAEAVDASNAKLMNLTEEEYAEVERLSKEIIDSLAAAVGKEDPTGPRDGGLRSCTASGSVSSGPPTPRRPMRAWRRCTWPTSASPLTTTTKQGKGQRSFSGTPSRPMRGSKNELEL